MAIDGQLVNASPRASEGYRGEIVATAASFPVEAMLAVNYRCNAKCRMCNIWKLKDDGSMLPSDYGRLPRSLQIVGITGGEPFLREDLLEIVRVVNLAADRPRIIINTNGYLTKRIIGLMSGARAGGISPGIRISLDGVGEKHDYMRGTRHAFEKVSTTLRALNDSGIRDVGVSFTATPENIDDLVSAYEYSREMKVQFVAGVAHNSDLYFHTQANHEIPSHALERSFREVISRQLSSGSLKNWFRAYFNDQLIEYHRTGRRPATCRAATDFLYVDPAGDAYPCLFLASKLGNIKDSEFSDIWQSDAARDSRAVVATCDRCWMMCTSRTGLKKAVLQAATWVAKEKLRGLAVGRFGGGIRGGGDESR